MSTSFFLNRRSFRLARTACRSGRSALYIAMTKSASDATDFYRLPTNRVIELGQQLVVTAHRRRRRGAGRGQGKVRRGWRPW